MPAWGGGVSGGRGGGEGLCWGMHILTSDCPSVNHNTRPIQPPHRNQTPRHILITPRNSNQTIIPLSPHSRLNRVSNNITRLKRISHPLRPHRHTVRNSNSIKLIPHQTLLLNPLLTLRPQLQKMHVTRVPLIPTRRDAYLRLIHVFLCYTGSVEHGLSGPALL